MVSGRSSKGLLQTTLWVQFVCPLPVAQHIGFLVKASAADVTDKGFFAGVCHQMLLQIPAGGGGVVTGVASIWLFTSVRRDVLLQSTRFTTRVRTSRTLVWLLP